jgi:hypothetical protein
MHATITTAERENRGVVTTQSTEISRSQKQTPSIKKHAMWQEQESTPDMSAQAYTLWKSTTEGYN